MSILIKGAEKQKECFFCDYRGQHDGICKVLHRSVLAFDMPPDCPIVEISPHGRLIDADKLADDLEQDAWSTDDDDKRDRELMLNAAAWLRSRNTPTVIESEEE